MSLSITTPQKMEKKKKIEIVAFIKNPYKPSALCVGHGQTAQTQIRRRIMRRLIWVSTVYSQNVLFKFDGK